MLFHFTQIFTILYLDVCVCVVFVNERDNESSAAELRFASQDLHCYMMYLFFFHTRNNWFSFVLHSISSLEKFMTFGCSSLTMAVVVVYFFFPTQDLTSWYCMHFIAYTFGTSSFDLFSLMSHMHRYPQTKLNALDHNFVNGSDINCVFYSLKGFFLD